MTKPESGNPYRVFWCNCGQKMRVPLDKLGRQGKCANCRTIIIPTMKNTVEPGEGPMTPPSQKGDVARRFHLFEDLEVGVDDRTPPPERPPSPPYGKTPALTPAEPLPITHDVQSDGKKREPRNESQEKNEKEGQKETPSSHDTIHTQSLRRLVEELRNKRDESFRKLGKIAFRLRDELPQEAEVLEIVEAILQCNRRIKKYEDVLREIRDAASMNDTPSDHE